MATSPGSRISQASVQIPLSVLPALEWVPLPFPKKQSRGTEATAFAATQAAREREQVLQEHMPLVRMVAYRILERLPQSVELDDLVSAGMVGLIDAYNKFDPSRKVLFRSYAAVRIRGAILDSLRGMDWAPREIRRKAREMEETTQRLTQRMGRKPQQSEVAAEMGMAFASFQQLLLTLQKIDLVLALVESRLSQIRTAVLELLRARLVCGAMWR
jgi:RNA polymerase sigma factor FliA